MKRYTVRVTRTIVLESTIDAIGMDPNNAMLSILLQLKKIDPTVQVQDGYTWTVIEQSTRTHGWTEGEIVQPVLNTP